MTDLHNWLDGLPCRHLLAVLDCCFAGAFRWASTRNLIPIPDVIHQERYERFIRDPAWQVITSAAYDQRALDVLAGDVLGQRGEGEQHSPFALALFEALAGAGDVVPAGGGDGVITATELYLYLRDKVEVQVEEQAHHRQTPGLWPLKKHDKGEYILLVPGHELNLPPAPELTAGLNPWRGLKSYDEEHCQLFFGRGDEVDELADLVVGQPFTAVLGASGTGKSSLVKAGLLPRLRGCDPNQGQVDAGGNGSWCILPPMRPGASPLGSLHALLAAHLPELSDALSLTKLRSRSTALADVVTTWSQTHAGCKLLLVVDQFEELLTLCQDEGERAQFLTLLARAVTARSEHLRVVVTLRSDFEPQFAEGSLLADVWAATRYVVPPMDHDDLQKVIEGPASERVLYFEPRELVDELITEVIQTPGALPLLSFTLSELYIKYLDRQAAARRMSETLDRSLIEADYRALGGVVGSLRHKATEEYEKLPDEAHRETMKRVMLRMVAVEGGELARRRVQQSELVYPDERENQRVDTVIRRLVQARLLVTLEEGGEATVEPAHDALVVAWDKLLLWKREAAEYLPLQRRVAQDAKDWGSETDAQQKAGLLWHNDSRLPALASLLSPDIIDAPPQYSTTNTLSKSRKPNQLRRFFARATQFVDRLRIANAPPDEERWLNALETEFVWQSVQRRWRNTRRLWGSVLTVFAIVVSLAILANSLRVSAQRQARVSQAQARAAQAETAIERYEFEQAYLFAMQAANATEQDGFMVPEAELALYHALELPLVAVLEEPGGDPVASVTFSPDGERLLMEGTLDTITLWSSTGALIETFEQVESVTFSPDGRYIVAIGTDGALQLMDSDGNYVSTIEERAAVGELEKFGPSEEVFLTVGRSEARVWDKDGNLVTILKLETEDVVPVHVVPVTVENLVRLWDHNGRFFLESMRLIRFSDDGSRIVTVQCDFFDSTTSCIAPTVQLWDGAGNFIADLQAHDNHIESIVFRSDFSGQRILIVDSSAAKVWDDQGNLVEDIKDQSGRIVSADLGKNGSIVTVWQDGKARLRNSHSYTIVLEVYTTSIYDTGIRQASFSPDGRYIVTVGESEARLWDSAGNSITALTGHGMELFGAGFSPDGRYIATFGPDRTARIWDGNGSFITSLDTPSAESARFSPDDELIVTYGLDRLNPTGSATAQLWDSAGNLVANLEGHANTVRFADFTSTGRQIITSDGEMTYLWDRQGKFTIALKGVFLAAANTDQGIDHIVTVRCDQSDENNRCVGEIAWLWDSNGTLIRTLEGYTDLIHSASFSADGQRIVTAGNEEVRLWDESGTFLSSFMSHTAGIESVGFEPNGNRIITAGCDQSEAAGFGFRCVAGTAKLWDRDGNLKSVLSGHTTEVISAHFSPDGNRIVTIGSPVGGETRLWDGEGNFITVLDWQRGRVTTASFSRHRNYIVTGGCDSLASGAFCRAGAARLWDRNGNFITAFTGHPTEVVSANFSPDGTRVATVGWSAKTGGNVFLWQVYTSVDTMVSEAIERLQPLMTYEECLQYLNSKTCTQVAE